MLSAGRPLDWVIAWSANPVGQGNMSVSSGLRSGQYREDEGVLALAVLGAIVLFFLMGWCIVDHRRPSMPHTSPVNASTAPSGVAAVTINKDLIAS